jgi:hypothetical protein
MTTVVAVEVVVAAVASLATAAVLLRGSRWVQQARSPMRWLALAALAWGAGLIAERAITGALDGTAVPVSFGDLASLLAVPVLVAGLMTMAAAGRPGPAGAGTAGATHGRDAAADQGRGAGPARRRLRAGRRAVRGRLGHPVRFGLRPVRRRRGGVRVGPHAPAGGPGRAGHHTAVRYRCGPPRAGPVPGAVRHDGQRRAGRRGPGHRRGPRHRRAVHRAGRVLPAGLHPAGRGRPGPAARRQPADARRHRAGPPGSARSVRPWSRWPPRWPRRWPRSP